MPVQENPNPIKAKPYNPDDFNKDEKLRMLLGNFSTGLQNVGKICEDASKRFAPDTDAYKVASDCFTIVDNAGLTGKTIIGPEGLNFDDDTRGATSRKYIPKNEIRSVISLKYLSHEECTDPTIIEKVNERLDEILTELGFDISEDFDG